VQALSRSRYGTLQSIQGSTTATAVVGRATRRRQHTRATTVQALSRSRYGTLQSIQGSTTATAVVGRATRRRQHTRATTAQALPRSRYGPLQSIQRSTTATAVVRRGTPRCNNTRVTRGATASRARYGRISATGIGLLSRNGPTNRSDDTSFSLAVCGKTRVLWRPHRNRTAYHSIPSTSHVHLPRPRRLYQRRV
jgi:hypothetical protein